MRRNVNAVLVLIVVLLAVLFIAPRLVPESVYREQIETRASAAIGRPVTLTGPISVSVLPRLEARAGDVAVANADGFGDEPLASVEELRASLALFPLLGRRVEIQEFVLVRPVVNLARDAGGRANWELAADAEPAAVSEGEASPQSAGAPSGDLSLGDVRLVEGRIVYADAQAGVARTLSDVNLAVSLESLSDPLRVNGDLVLDEEPIGLRFTLANPAAFLEGTDSAFDAVLDGRLATGSVEGQARGGDDFALDAQVDLEVPSIAALAAFAEVEGVPPALETVSVAGRMRATANGAAAFEQAVIRASGDHLSIAVDGDASLAPAIGFGGDVTLESADLSALAGQFDVDLPARGDVYRNFKIAGRAEGDLDGVGFVGPLSSTPDAGGAVLELDALRGVGTLQVRLTGERPAVAGALPPNVRALTPFLPAGAGAPAQPASGGAIPPWSEEPIDLSALQAADADIRLTVDGLAVQAYEFGRSEVSVTLDDGLLVARLSELSAYGGAASGLVRVNSRAVPARYTVQVNMNAVNAQPLLTAAANFTRLTGLGGGDLDLTTSGGSVAELMANLNGTGGFNFADGALAGVDLAQVAGAVQTAIAEGVDFDTLLQGDLTARDFLSPGFSLRDQVSLDSGLGAALAAFGPDQSTPFSELLGGFAMENGIAQIDDITLSALNVSTTLSGSINMAEQSYDLTITPIATGALAQEVPEEWRGIGLPIGLSGPWGQAAPRPNVDALTAIVGQRLQLVAQQRLREEAGGALDSALGDALGGEAGGLLRDALGLPQRPSDPDAPEAADEDEPSVEDQALQALGGLLRQRQRSRDEEEGEGDGGS